MPALAGTAHTVEDIGVLSPVRDRQRCPSKSNRVAITILPNDQLVLYVTKSLQSAEDGGGLLRLRPLMCPGYQRLMRPSDHAPAACGIGCSRTSVTACRPFNHAYGVVQQCF